MSKECINCGKVLGGKEKGYRLHKKYLCNKCSTVAKKMLLPVMTCEEKRKKDVLIETFEDQIRRSGYRLEVKKEITNAFRNYMSILLGGKQKICYGADISFERARRIIFDATKNMMFLTEFAKDEYEANGVKIGIYLFEHYAAINNAFQGLTISVISFDSRTVIKSYGFAGGTGVINCDFGSGMSLNSKLWNYIFDKNMIEFEYLGGD